MSTSPAIGIAMLIDDSALELALHRRVIERSGHVARLLTFDYAAAALDHLRSPDREPVDVIFLDIRMPRMDGFEFLERATAELGARFVRRFVVVLSTSRDPRDVERSRGFAAVAEHLRKPLDAVTLERIARNAAIARTAP